MTMSATVFLLMLRWRAIHRLLFLAVNRMEHLRCEPIGLGLLAGLKGVGCGCAGRSAFRSGRTR